MRKQLDDISYVKGLQSDLRACFESEAGKVVMEFLENSCGWYVSIFDPANRDLTLINDGRRQVVATLKNLLRLSAQEVVDLVKKSEGR
jgi:hypothetical protein